MIASGKHGNAGEGKDAHRVNTLGMDKRVLTRLVDALESRDRSAPNGGGKRESGGKRPSGSRQRTHARWRFLNEAITLELAQPAGGSLRMIVACRDLSAGGINLLHRAYVHTNTACTVRLPHPTDGTIEAHGTIVRCQHIAGMVHELGVKFDTPIEIKEFLPYDGQTTYFSYEHVDTEKLVGRMLLVDEGDLDREIVRHFLKDTSLRVTECKTGQDALSLLDGSVTVVVMDHHLPDMSAGEFIGTLREAQVNIPVLLLSSDKSEQGRLEAERSGANATLIKPVTQDLLLRVLGEFLIPRQEEKTGASIAPKVPRELTDQFLDQVRRSATDLQSAIAKEDAMSCYATCMRLGGTAPCFGHGGLARVAETAGQILSLNMNIEEARNELETLLKMCQRIGHAA